MMNLSKGLSSIPASRHHRPSFKGTHALRLAHPLRLSPLSASRPHHSLEHHQQEKQETSAHLAGKWGELAELLFPDVDMPVEELDGGVEESSAEDAEQSQAEGDEEAHAQTVEDGMPADVASHIGGLISGFPDMPQVAFPAARFCINCCCPVPAPLHSATCPACHWQAFPQAEELHSNSNAQLLDPAASEKWAALLSQQQQQVKGPQGLHAGVALCFDERMLLHRASLPPYPERPERLTAILTRLQQQGLAPLCRLTPARAAALEELLAVHSPDLVNRLAAASAAAAAAAAAAAGSTMSKVADSSDQTALDTSTAGSSMPPGGASPESDRSMRVSAPELGVAGSLVDAAGSSTLLACIAAAGAARESSAAQQPVGHEDSPADRSSTASSMTVHSSDSQGDSHVIAANSEGVATSGVGVPSASDTVDVKLCSQGYGEWEGHSHMYGGTLAPDTLVSAHTFEAASLAAGCAAQLAKAVVRGEVGSGFALIRPHGHHANFDTAQSGCYFNNAAVAARAAQAAGAERVLIVDWDIHHGQGTEELFINDESVMVVSLHREDEEFYPKGYGQVTDVGLGEGRGYTFNIPWQDNLVTDADYLQCMLHVVLPMAHQFQPDMVVVSAGFDGADGDFFGQTSISPACYAHMTHMLLGLAPCVFVLEGGYNLDATARCVEACLRVMLGARPPRLTEEGGGTGQMSTTGTAACMNAMQIQGEFWSSLSSLNLNGWMSAIKERQAAASESDDETEKETETEDEDDVT